MTTSGDLRAAEESMRRLLADENLPEPDEVEYRETELVFLWHETRTAVVVEVGGEGGAPDGDPSEDGHVGGAPGEDPNGMAQRDGPWPRGGDRA